MNSQNAFSTNSKSGADAVRDTGSAEATLRLIASLPAPDGLERRVIAGLRSAPPSRQIISWPAMLKPPESLFRAAAAAAIVFVIAGGGWGIYTQVQPRTIVVAPFRVNPSGGFSNAGAMRTPQTVPAPVVAQPAPQQPTDAKPPKKVRSKVDSANQDPKAKAVRKDSAQPSVTIAK